MIAKTKSFKGNSGSKSICRHANTKLQYKHNQFVEIFRKGFSLSRAVSAAHYPSVHMNTDIFSLEVKIIKMIENRGIAEAIKKIKMTRNLVIKYLASDLTITREGLRLT
jgi:hypothetical protein